jgi:acylphosphatase
MKGFEAVAEHDRVQREIHYTGRVQGVGFRYTVRSVAAQFNVTGFVRNLPDGRVHLVAEGAVDEVDRFLAAVDAEMQGYIRDTKDTTAPAMGWYKTFEIRH